MKAIQSAHESWDKTKRKWEGTVQRSQNNANTKDTQFERDLIQLIAKGVQLDEKNLALEKAYISQRPFTDKELTDGAARCAELKAMIASGNKKSSAVLNWCNIK